MPITLSIVVPVYGTEKYLRTCLDSIINQSLKNIEVILVDDCSPDKSRDILIEYTQKDSRFKMITYEKNKGLFGARVSGADVAQGEYITFLDSDDYISIDFYRLATEKAQNRNFDIVMGDTIFVNEQGTKIIRPAHKECTIQGEYLGEDLTEAFFSQEMSCYSWHTVWNKIYKKTLWDKCAPYYHKLTHHIIMTEDIAFSSLLFYEADSFVHIHTPSVFYCQHATSSTGDSHANVKKALKNYKDIITVFDFVENYLKEKKDDHVLHYLHNARTRYCSLWHQPTMDVCAMSAKNQAQVTALSKQLAPDWDGTRPTDLAWFEKNTLIWDDTLEKIKSNIFQKNISIVSFDIFDTLILRPFAKPTDLFETLQADFDQIYGKSQISFSKIRQKAEAIARTLETDREDITLQAIYIAMENSFGIDHTICLKMMRLEQEAEIRFAQPRHTGIELFKFAQACQKQVILISDMYLDKMTICQMLEKCGISGWKAFFLSSEEGVLKWSGNLFRCAINELSLDSSKILHIGDNSTTDYDSAKKAGLHAFRHPKPMEVFHNRGKSLIGELGKQSLASIGSINTMEQDLSVRCMHALIANKYYDCGFQSQNPRTYFSSSPALLGYSAVGPHILAVADWLIKIMRENNYTYIAFLARDGFLIKQAVEHLLPDDLKSNIKLDYIVASRKILMPALVMNRLDFYSLPINWHSYTPAKLWQLLNFCSDNQEDIFRQTVQANNISWDKAFSSERSLDECVTLFLSNHYDKQKHEEALNCLREYYSPLKDSHAACFDMGYSGRLQAAICNLCERPVPVCFIHQDDANTCDRLKQTYQFAVHNFYDIKPGMSGALREFLLSSTEPGAAEIVRKNTKITVQYNKSEYNQAAKFIVTDIQYHALSFVKDWKRIFSNTSVVTIPHQLFSMPFESALRYMKSEDINIFSGCSFDDTVYAGKDKLDLSVLIREQAKDANKALHTICDNTSLPMANDDVVFYPANVGRIKKAIGYLLFDHNKLIYAINWRLYRFPRLRKLLKTIYFQFKKLTHK